MKVPTEAEMQAMKDRLEIRGSSLWWKVRGSTRIDMTKPAGRRNKVGYQQISLTVDQGDRLWLAHRVAYFLHHGTWPAVMLDHKDQDKQNNDPENLRLTTSALNRQNTAAHTDNALGVKGVRQYGKGYEAYLTVQGTQHSKKLPTLQQAIDHRRYLEETFHPFAPSQQNVV